MDYREVIFFVLIGGQIAHIQYKVVNSQTKVYAIIILHGIVFNNNFFIQKELALNVRYLLQSINRIYSSICTSCQNKLLHCHGVFRVLVEGVGLSRGFQNLPFRIVYTTEQPVSYVFLTTMISAEPYHPYLRESTNVISGPVIPTQSFVQSRNPERYFWNLTSLAYF